MPNAIYSSAGFQFNVFTETAFNSGTVAGTLGALGIGAKFTSFELDNAWTEAYEIGQRIPQAYFTAGLSAPVSIDFYLCQDEIGWLAFVLGPATGGTYTVGNAITTGQVELNTAQGNLFTVGGIAFTTCKVSIATGQMVAVSMQGMGTSFSSTVATVAVGAIPSQLITWKDCSVGSSLTTSLVQSCDFTIDTGAKNYYALGSAQYQTYLPLQSKITCNVTAFHNDPAFDVIYQLVSDGTLTVTFGSHTATFEGCYLTKGVMDLEPVKEVTDQISFSALQLTIV